MQLAKRPARKSKQNGAARTSTLSPVGEGGFAKCSRVRGLYPRKKNPHPSRTASAPPSPQGEKEAGTLDFAARIPSWSPTMKNQPFFTKRHDAFMPNHVS